jgi:hypothetical protein
MPSVRAMPASDHCRERVGRCRKIMVPFTDDSPKPFSNLARMGARRVAGMLARSDGGDQRFWRGVVLAL